MKDLIGKEYKHLLWKDELFNEPKSTKHTFLILKYAEVYRYSQDELGLYIWSRRKAVQLVGRGLIYNFNPLGGLDMAFAKIGNLGQIIAWGAFKRRPAISGKWLKSRKILLGHKILPYRPITLN